MFSREKLFWLSLYLVTMLGITWGLLRARQQALIKLDTEQAQGDWQDWRQAAGQLSTGEGPVKRSVPKSKEPPGLVLLRDHLATSWLIVTVLTSVVFATMALMVRGVLVGPKFNPQADDP